jgi:hypothetical protein
MITIIKPWALEKDLKELLEKKPNIKEFEEEVGNLIEDHVGEHDRSFGYSTYDNLAELLENVEKQVLMDVLSDLFEPSDLVKNGRWA